MKLTMETIDWTARKKAASQAPDTIRFRWFPRLERERVRPRTGPDGARSHEYRIWVLIGWGGVMIELVGNKGQDGGFHDRQHYDLA